MPFVGISTAEPRLERSSRATSREQRNALSCGEAVMAHSSGESGIETAASQRETRPVMRETEVAETLIPNLSGSKLASRPCLLGAGLAV